MVRPKILFVDDNPILLRAFKHAMTPMFDSWEPYFVASAPEALNILETVACDVVVTDLDMPRMDGITLLEQIAVKYPNCVRFVFSGTINQNYPLRVIHTAHQYLSQPFDVIELFNRLAKARVDGALSSVDNQTAACLSNIVGGLPSAPSIYRSLIEAAHNTHLCTEDVALIISKDISITAEVLRLVNSSFFGLRQHITTVSEAVGYLGLATIRSLVLALESFSAFPEVPFEEFHLKQLWDQSLRIGLMAQQFVASEHADVAVRDEVLSAGLLHGIGTLVLATRLPIELRASIQFAKNQSIELIEAQRIIIGTDYAAIGSSVLCRWGLPDSLCQIVKYHRAPSLCTSPSLALLSVHCAYACVHETEKLLDHACPETMEVWHRMQGKHISRN